MKKIANAKQAERTTHVDEPEDLIIGGTVELKDLRGSKETRSSVSPDWVRISPKALQQVRFPERPRGYDPEDVDHFLEQVAAGIEVMQGRLRQAIERAENAESASADFLSDALVRNTFLLAQRTADLAVQEAHERALRIVAAAEREAQTILANAEGAASSQTADEVEVEPDFFGIEYLQDDTQAQESDSTEEPN